MPPGNARARTPVKVVERTTVEACIAIAQNIQEACRQAGDVAGCQAAQGVVRRLKEELLGNLGPPVVHPSP